MSQSPIASRKKNSPPSQTTDTSQIPVDSLETIRNKLNQVHLSLRKLSDQINLHNRHPNKVKLPSYAHFQNQFQVLITQLHSIATNISNNDELLQNTNVYPTPLFPTTQQEALLTTLLRKKALPEVDEWTESAIKTRDLMSSNGTNNLQKEDEFAEWSFAKVKELRDSFQFYGFHTVEELTYLETDEGKREAHLKKDAESKKDDIELSITAGGKKGLNPNQVLKFMYQGEL
ncbi:mediator complex, subunit Med8 [Scheffersomyces coipomensis]|uniref:mediator complex, subunit Med8 n=1 Tax=Scheffersomyces coipomensis TaxID=1788519 RepID=UPI00315D969D